MAFIAAIFLLVGFSGLVGATFGAPLAAWGIRSLRWKGKPTLALVPPPAKMSLEVLVAAHNEESVIAQTLQSIHDAAVWLKAVYGDVFDLKITVGLDHCTDGTESAVGAFSEQSAQTAWGISGLTNPGERGKWNLLGFLIGQSKADWVILVDAGTVWETELLSQAWPNLNERNTLAVAPSYVPQGAGRLEQMSWKLEQSLKHLECKAGGPISVHGATVLYRRSTLVTALAKLQGSSWLNDDVVVPLTLRLQNPQGRIVYMSEGAEGGWVSDLGVRSELDVEFRRRRRMVVGNLQWVRRMLLPNIGTNLEVTFIALRRVFRLLWAYWVLSIGIGLGVLVFSALGLLGTMIAASALALVLIFSNWLRRLSMAFLSGLQIPRYWRELNHDRGVSWI